MIQGYTELALEHNDLPEEVHGYLKEVDQAADRATHLTRQLLAFGRRQYIRRLSVDLSEFVAGLEPMLVRLIPEDVEQAFDLDPNLSILGDPGQIEQVLVNLVVNARDAMPSGGTLGIETRKIGIDDELRMPHTDATPGAYARLRVTDSGCGMTGETLTQIFDPFYTTKPEQQGSGLGLSVAQGIVSQHGGFLCVDSEVGIGTQFSMYLPIVAGPANESTADKNGPIRGGTETILHVEDEAAVRQFGHQTLENAGYTVRSAANGAAALEDFAANADRIDLVLLDVVMPTMTGRQAQERMHAIAPDVPAVFVSGHVGDDVRTDFVTERGLDLISKPYTKRSLLRKIREVLDRGSQK